MDTSTNAGGAATAAPTSGGVTSQPDLKSSGGPSGVQNGVSATSSSNNSSAPISSAAANDWTTSLPESAKLYISQKGFKDPAAVLDSYQNLEKLMGAPKERLLRLPDKADAPEWSEVYDKLGRPKEASEYKFAPPNGGKQNPEFTDWAQKQFHALGLTKAQGESLASKWNDYAMGEVQKQQEAINSGVKAEQSALQKEWGGAYEQQIKTCFKAAQTFGLGQEEVTKLQSALGYSATLKFLASIGSKLGEDSFVGGEGGGGFKGALTPERAQAELAELRQDTDFVKRYVAGGMAEKQKMERLMRFAYPDQPQD